MAQLMAAMAVVSAVSSIAGGISKREAAQREASSLEDQATLSQQEAQIEADIHATQVRKFAANQKSAFLKNGVTLDGSPLLVLEDTRRSGQEEVNAIVRSGAAKAQLLREKAAQTRSEGRAALIGGIGQGAGTLATLGLNAKGAGLFGGSASSGGSPADSFRYGTASNGQTIKISNPYV